MHWRIAASFRIVMYLKITRVKLFTRTRIVGLIFGDRLEKLEGESWRIVYREVLGLTWPLSVSYLWISVEMPEMTT